MLVKDLKKALEKLDEDAIVCVEANSDCAAYIVKQYNLEDGRKFVYIADNLEYVEGVFAVLVAEAITGYEEE